MYHLDKALMSLIETEFLFRGHALYLFFCRRFWIGTILLLTTDENSGWENKILIV